MLIDTPRLHQLLEQQQIDSLVLRLGENLLATTGYWPVAGLSCAIQTHTGVTLVIPRREQEFLPSEYSGELFTFEPEYVPDAEAELARLVREHLPAGRAGHDFAYGPLAANNTAGELRLPPKDWYARAVGEGVECSAALAAFRAIKTPAQVERIRRSQRFALRGIQRACEALLQPGIKEIQLAARIEAEIEGQLGDEDSQRVRAFCFVQAGLNSALAGDTISISGSNRLQTGDLVVIELGTVVDGYWSDITRTVSVGASPHQWLLDKVREAQAAAVAALRPGIIGKEADQAARDLLGDLNPYYHHNLGHGVGFAYHEPPFLGRRSEAVLAQGQVVTVEPGVYIKGQAGARWEDNVLITAAGAEVLSRLDE